MAGEVPRVDRRTPTFRLFGTVEARLDGKAVEVGATRERSLLVGLLLAKGRPVERHALFDWIWDCTPDSASGELHRFMTRLRARLREWGIGEALVNRDRLCRLDIPPETVDVHRFHDLVSVARASDDVTAATALAEALRLSAGDPFAGLSGHTIDGHRQALVSERIDAEILYCGAELRLGRHLERLKDLERLAALRPADSVVARYLMHALYRSGRQAEALRSYEDHRACLAGHGLEVPKDLERLQLAVLRHDDSLWEFADGRPDSPRVVPRPSENERPVSETELAIARESEDLPETARHALAKRHLAILVGTILDGRRSALKLLDSTTSRRGQQILEVVETWSRPTVDALPAPRSGHGYLLTLGNDPTDVADVAFVHDLLTHEHRLADRGAHLAVVVTPELWREAWEAAREVAFPLIRPVPPENLDLSREHLSLLNPNGVVTVYPLHHHRTPTARVRFGRTSAGTLRPDIELDTGTLSPISREHAEMMYRQGKWWFVAMGRNRPWVRRRGESAHSRVDVRMPLRDGDTVLIDLKPTADRRARRWEIEFRDPQDTSTVQGDDQ